MLSAIDHIVIVVRDLPAVRDRYAAFLQCDPLHVSADRSGQVWFQLGNVGLNIVALRDDGHALSQVLNQSQHEGFPPLEPSNSLLGIAFATNDLPSECKTVSRRGVQTTPLTEYGPQSTVLLSPEATFGATLLFTEPARRVETSTAKLSASKIDSLDHVVVTTANPDRAAALYGARLGLELKLDRTNPAWNARLMFFKCGDLIVEVAHALNASEPNAHDKIWGLSWRVTDIAAAHQRIVKEGFSVSDIRQGRKPGTRVFTVRDAPANVPTIVIAKSDER